MIPYVLLAIGTAIGYLAYRTRKVENPKLKWNYFNRKGSKPLGAVQCKELEGIYKLDEGEELFGKQLVLKWSYAIEGGRPQYFISFFTGKDGCFAVCEARANGDELMLHGYWRKLEDTARGTLRLIRDAEGSFYGFWGEGEEKPSHPLQLTLAAKLLPKKPLAIIGHRGGGRNVDFLPVSENSLEMLKLAPALGATGVEIDVRLTRDGIPVIFHDSFLSAHTIRGSVYSGALSNFTLAELRKKELRKGGRVPTLREALYTLLYETPIETVWLDIKYLGSQEEVRSLQQEFLARAAKMGRDMKIYIGIPDQKVLAHFLELRDHNHLPSLVELEEETVEAVGADVWAPQYTEGIEQENIRSLQQQGRKVFVWSLDHRTMISTYLEEGGYDGIVTNAAPVVAYEYYTGSYKLQASGR